MHRLIVTSATYRQSSQARPDLATVDPENRLLARQSRLRLDAELIRDAALAASGLLTPDGRRPERLPAAARRRDDARPDPPRVDGRAPGPTATAAASTPSSGGRRRTRPSSSSTPPTPPRPAPAGPLEHAAPGADAANDEAFFEFAEALAERVLEERRPVSRLAFDTRSDSVCRGSWAPESRVSASCSPVSGGRNRCPTDRTPLREEPIENPGLPWPGRC